VRRSCAAFVAALSLLTTTSAASARRAPDAVMSDNVEYLGSIKQDVGLTTGAKVVGDRLFVTSGKNISIYDISDAANPQPLGGMKANVAWENERSDPTGRFWPSRATSTRSASRSAWRRLAPTGACSCRRARPERHRQVGRSQSQPHGGCALDCQSSTRRVGTIVRPAVSSDGTPPKVIGNWITELRRRA